MTETPPPSPTLDDSSDASEVNRTPVIEVRQLSKSFPGVQALDRVDFSVHRGEIHALLGGNGAGKSTLIRILGGIETADEGQIRIDGNERRELSIHSALERGLRVIHQELVLAPNLTVAENIFLGAEPQRPLGLLGRRTLHRQADELIAQLGFPLSSRARVADLAIGHRQLVEIARAVSGEPRLLLLDEPTAALDDAEAEQLFDELAKLKARGIAMIYITHRLEEVFRIADRVTILRDGKSVHSADVATLTRESLVDHLVDGGLASQMESRNHKTEDVVLESAKLTTAHVRDVSFSLHRGEILGVAGQMGAGRTELGYALCGVDPIRGGTLRIGDQPRRWRCLQDAVQAGVILIPEDRRKQGFFPRRSVAFNLSIAEIRRWLKLCFPSRAQRESIVGQAITRLQIKARPRDGMHVLSGGNQQKIVIGKWLGSQRTVFVLDDPMRGIDVGAKEEIFAIIQELARNGAGVVFISSEIPEVLRISDRVLVLRHGRQRALLPRAEATEEKVMRLAAGE